MARTKHLTLPGDTVKKLLRVLRGHKDMEVGITLPSERNSVTFTLPNIQISTQLLEGRFPDFARIIPRSPISQVVMYAADMKVALLARQDLRQGQRQLLLPEGRAGVKPG